MSTEYKGSMNPDIEISDGMVIAYCEALSGALLCIIPEPTSKIAAGLLFGDAVTRTAAFLEQRSMKNQAKQLERESNLGREGRTEHPCGRALAVVAGPLPRRVRAARFAGSRRQSLRWWWRRWPVPRRQRRLRSKASRPQAQ